MFDLSPADRVLQFSSLSFDIAIEELFPAWIRGAAVVFRDEQALLGPSEFSSWVAGEADHRPRPADGLLARLGRGPGQPRRAASPNRSAW